MHGVTVLVHSPVIGRINIHIACSFLCSHFTLRDKESVRTRASTDLAIINLMGRPFKGKYCNAPVQTGCQPLIRDHLFTLLGMSVNFTEIRVGMCHGERCVALEVK